MRALILLFKVFLILWITFPAYVQHQEVQLQVRQRKKRFLIFPKGTVIQLVYCYLMSALGSDGIFTVGVTLGTNWDVPVDLEKLMYDQNMKVVANRRDRRSLYPKIEYILDQLGLNGRHSITKLLCQAHHRKYAQNKRYSFIEEIIHVIFQYPELPAHLNVPKDEYDYILQQCSVRNDV